MSEFEKQSARTKQLFDIDMQYQPGKNNNETGKLRRKFSMKVAGRFSYVAPVLIKSIYGIDHRLALLHLNKLSDEGYLQLYKTPRVIDGRLYLLTHAGACYASELINTMVPFRSHKQGAQSVNLNAISHDMMNAYTLLKGVNNKDKHGNQQPIWDGFVAEREFARLYPQNHIRNVDGLVRECDVNQTIAAVEIENSYKNKTMRAKILLKLKDSLRAGIYEKVFMISQKREIFEDIKRFHNQLFSELSRSNSKKQSLSIDEVELLSQSIIFRTKFCDELKLTFYPYN